MSQVHTVKNTNTDSAYGNAKSNSDAQFHPLANRNTNPDSTNCHPNINIDAQPNCVRPHAAVTNRD